MTSWRDAYRVHPAADALPMLADGYLRELGEDIKKHGLRTPVVLWSETADGGDGSVPAYLLDGRNRLDAMELVGMATTEVGDQGQHRLSHQIDAKYLHSDPAAYVITANLRRRHLRPRDLVLHAMAIRTAATTGGRSEPLRGAEYRDATGTLRQTRPNDRVSAKGGRGHKGEATEIAEQTGVPARTVRRVLREVVQERRTTAHVGHNSGQTEWYTPRPYIDAARAVMGGIDLDPASTATANEVVKAGAFYTAEQDGLIQPWAGRVWLNPPYAQPAVQRFCDRLAEQVTAGHVDQAVLLVNNATETAWFQRLATVAGAICFPAGRVRFWHPDRHSSTPLQGQAVLYFGPAVDAFRAEFLRFGFTVPA